MAELETSVIGFDSAWTDNPKAPGAVCAIRVGRDGSRSFCPPVLSRFGEALEFIQHERAAADRCLVALDQPTLVPNQSGMRPVEKVAAAVISWIGGAQPTNRSKVGMFDDAAPVWAFKSALGAIEDPERARQSKSGLFLMEVFPALALPSFGECFCGPKRAPRYNPGNRKRFRPADWSAVVATAEKIAAEMSVAGVSEWLSDLPTSPRKGNQDQLDALLCALIGLRWLYAERERSVMIGDLALGYMVAPVVGEVLNRLRAAGIRQAVPVA